MEKVDLLICGAGPVGLLLAVECARQGINFAIVEKNAERAAFSKSLAIWSNTLETLDSIGIIDQFFAKGSLLKQFIFYKKNKPSKPVSTTHGMPSKFPYPLIIPQSEPDPYPN